MPEEKDWKNGGKFMRVDLTNGRIWSEQVDEETYRKYLGGTGYGAKGLYEEVPPEVEWSDPENRLIIANGPCSNTPLHGSGTLSFVSKGPMTHLAVSTQANGYAGAWLQ